MSAKADKLKQQASKRTEVANLFQKLKKFKPEVSLKEVNENFDTWKETLVRWQNGEEPKDQEQLEVDHKVKSDMNQLLKVVMDGVNEIYEAKDITSVKFIDGKVVEYNLVVIPHNLIEETTFVAGENYRNPNALNEYNLEYILKTLRNEGQKYEAEGFWEDGKIGVVDGSSRRMACVIAKRPYLIWATRSKLSSKTKAEHSDIANTGKRLSTYEQGTKAIAEMKHRGIQQIDLAAEWNVTQGRMSIYVNSHDVPSEFYKLFKRNTSVPRNVVEKLISAHSKLVKQNKLDDFLEDIETQNLKPEEDKVALVFITNWLKDNLAVAPTKIKRGWTNTSIGAYRKVADKAGGTLSFEIQESDAVTIGKLEEAIANILAQK